MGEWINAKVGIPLQEEPVLIIYRARNSEHDEYDEYLLHGIAGFDGESWCLFEPILDLKTLPENHKNLIDVTHWMPLPEAPTS